MKRLTDKDIENFYKEFDTPEHVKAHCRGVTECALKLAHALMDTAPESYHFDLELLYGAGMVHDMARRFDRHEAVAADALQQSGFDEESDIVREHMRCNTYHEISEVTEADLLYISDRMVQEDTFVGLEKRFEYIKNKMRMHGVDPDNERSRQNRANAFEFVAAIEGKTGRSIFDIVQSQ